MLFELDKVVNVLILKKPNDYFQHYRLPVKTLVFFDVIVVFLAAYAGFLAGQATAHVDHQPPVPQIMQPSSGHQLNHTPGHEYWAHGAHEPETWSRSSDFWPRRLGPTQRHRPIPDWCYVPSMLDI